MTWQLLWLGFLLRLAIATWNGFWGPSFGAEADAANYHQMAVAHSLGVTELTPNRIQLHLIYSYFLGSFYYFTANSLFLGSVLSCGVWVMSAALLNRVMGLLSFPVSQRRKAMLIYAVLPTSILWTGVTIREPYQLLFINLSMYAAVKVSVGLSPWNWLLLFVAVAAGSVLHAGLFIFGVTLIVACIATYVARQRRQIRVVASLIVMPILILALVTGYRFLTNAYSYGLGGGLTSAVEDFQRRGLMTDSRAVYRHNVTIEDPFDLVTFVPAAVLQYWFEPLLWRMSRPFDVAFALENLLRAFLIWMAVAGLWRASSHRRWLVLPIFLSYLAIETAWALGTFNWGTAARHHVPSVGLLLVAGLAHVWPERRAE
ncbi:MAG: hypothetical protein Q8O42_01980 [Acidobacteriota bacterium]|nr:hypothetical protein [Acidobacteriota bacterium]